ncbi:MAG: iron ABC transporter permease [Planctomycetota bacterium]|nr:iron ABC transporter permease [Planctomycetota bacterium]
MMRDRKNAIVFGVLLAALVAACTLAVFCGAVRVPLREMAQSNIVRLRCARILLAVVTGAALSTSGVIFQAILRNPLAEPYVLGISSGAGLGAALAIVFGLHAAGAWTLPGMAFAGALGTILLVYALARTAAGGIPAPTLLLSGAIVNAVLGSLLMFLVSVTPSEDLHNVVWWLLGNLQVFDWQLLRVVAMVVAAGLAMTVLCARDLNLLALGEEPAAHLGLHVERTVQVFFLVASLMTGATVAACGLIGFVGLIVPHAVRLSIGPDHRRLVPAAALAGATFLVLADVFARTVMAPLEIPIGVITSLLGGPFFLFLLRRRTSAYRS